MKRAYRRAHLVLWLLIAPITAAGLALAVLRAPLDTAGTIPAAAVTGEDR